MKIFLNLCLIWYQLLLQSFNTSAFVPSSSVVPGIGRGSACSTRTASSLDLLNSSPIGSCTPLNDFKQQHHQNHHHAKARRTNKRTLSTSLSVTLSTAVATAASARGLNSYFLVRILFLRGLAFVYITAFLVALRQNKGLIGDNGITPARDVLDHVELRAREKRSRREEPWPQPKTQGKTMGTLPKSIHSNEEFLSIAKNTKVGRIIGNKLNSSVPFQDMREILWDRTDQLGRLYPSVLWFMSKDDRARNMNGWLDAIAMSGIGLSLSMFVLGAANIPMLMGLWICQRSIMSVGGPWYQFGWEPQLAELTFHAMFMAPLLSLSQIPCITPVPVVTLWAMRWLSFRIMMGAGLIKLRSGDPKWKLSGPQKLSTMDYFYETQPIPNPLTRYFHKMPKAWHRFEVLANHFVELIAPWMLILPLGRNLRIAGGAIQIIFQCVLITSGNLSFLNWLTMLPAIYCFDDAFVSKLFTPGFTTSASIAAYTHLSTNMRQFTNIAFLFLIAKLSIPVVQNLLSKRQIMNGSFDPLRLVNTYGAFGTVEEERIELIIEAAYDYNGPWKEYEFKVKPGKVNRVPRFISPYHYRLDWLLWIAALGGNIDRNPWIYSLLAKLLEQDPEVKKLIAVDPFEGEDKPKYIRVMKYKYRFGKNGEDYWVRNQIGKFFPRQGLCSLEVLNELVH